MTGDWSKSSACDGGGCVEVAFHKSTASTDGECVEVGFHKSSASAGNGACVEVAQVTCDDPDCKYRSDKEGNLVLVRDSKDPDGPVLKFTEDEWAAFLVGAKGDEFDLQAA